MSLIRLDRIEKTFPMGQTAFRALDGVDLDVDPGEFLAIVGPSGSGKTTLLNILGLIERASAGRVHMFGEDLSARSFDELAAFRGGRVGFIFQSFNLLGSLTAQENAEFPLLRGRLSRRERYRRSLAALSEVGLEGFASHKPGELSGGQRQRVGIARALVAGPELVLADEPTANLDQKTGLEIIALMKELNERRKTTFIFSTHDPKIMSAAGRIVHIANGRILEAAACIGD